MKRMWILVSVIPCILSACFAYIFFNFSQYAELTIVSEVLSQKNLRFELLLKELNSQYESNNIAVLEIFKSIDSEDNIISEKIPDCSPHSFSLWKKSTSDWKLLQACFTQNTDQSCIEKIKSAIPIISLNNKLIITSLNEEIENYIFKIKLGILTAIILMPAAIFTIHLHYNKYFYAPLQKILHVVTQATSGVISDKIGYDSSDEIGHISKAVDQIMENQVKVSAFAEYIGDGNFEIDYKILSTNDKLGISLSNMREKLIKVSEEEGRRRWANEGLAKFAEILRTDNGDQEKLCDNILFNLVKYIKGNQGRLFITAEEENTKILTLKSAYAWDRKKFLEQNILFGEGLVGQAALEMDTLFLTDIPKNYISITSGTGAATPTCIIVLPLKINGHLHGVIELASFNELKKFEIEFLEKLSEVIASTLSNVEINENTRKLLEESRKMTNNLQVQEEELRQNTQELRATQENLHKMLEDAKGEMRQQIVDIENEKRKNIAILEGCVDGVVTFDQTGRIEFFNKSAEAIWNCSREVAMGKNISELLNVQILQYGNRYEVWHLGDNNKKALDVRSEISIKTSSNEEWPILVTLSRAEAGNQQIFTAFIQSIAVELF